MVVDNANELKAHHFGQNRACRALHGSLESAINVELLTSTRRELLAAPRGEPESSLVARTADQAWSAGIPIADDLFLRLCEAASAQEPFHLRISGNVSTSMRRYAKCLMAGK